MRFEFATANRIIFGAGTLRQVGALAAEMGKRALVVTGWTTERTAVVLDVLGAHGVEAILLNVTGEPTTDLVQLGTERARVENCDVIIGFGGGSAVDTGTAVAALLPHCREPL